MEASCSYFLCTNLFDTEYSRI